MANVARTFEQSIFNEIHTANSFVEISTESLMTPNFQGI